MPKNTKIIFRKKEGKFSTRFEKIKIVLHGFDKIENVSVYNKIFLQLKKKILLHSISQTQITRSIFN